MISYAHLSKASEARLPWNLDTFTDVRDLKAAFQAAGVPFDASDPNLNTDGPSGPASFVVVDPDGNPILIDQHR